MNKRRKLPIHNLDFQTVDASSTLKQHGRNSRNDLQSYTIQRVGLESPGLGSPSRSVGPEADSFDLVSFSYTRTKPAKTVTISIKTFNELKPRLARAKRFNKFLEVPEELWIKNAGKLKQELNSAPVKKKCLNFGQFPLQKFVSLFTLASKHSVSPHATKYNAFDKTRHD